MLAICAATHAGQSTNYSRQRAVDLWEEAIRAKGGRERLHSIQNLLISSTIDVRAQRGSNIKETERLYVMPGKAWIYTYTPEFDVSLDATVINKERHFCWLTLAPKSNGNGVPELSPCIPETPIQYLIQEPIVYLMETDSLRPEILEARTEGKGKKQLDVIETKVAMLRIDFYLDPKTRLPIKLVTECYGEIGRATGRLGPMTIKLEDYISIDGVQMPRRVTRELEAQEAPVGERYGDIEEAGYKFNVAYDPNIFESPISKKVKRGDWKLQTHE